MHTLIYPIKNSYITNESGYESSNFSLDSTLEIKSLNTLVPVYNYYVPMAISGSSVCASRLYDFTGSFIGNVNGYASVVDLYISGSGNFKTENFSGFYTSSTVTNFSGSISGSVISGSMAGIFSGSMTYISGTMSHFTGSIYPTSSYVGTSSFYNPYVTYNVSSSVSRALLQFDLSSISASIVNGDIANSGSLKYYLTLRNAFANELPISYSLVAYPIRKAWDIGNGRYQLGGSSIGVSWKYRDYDGGILWDNEGGELYPNISASQHFLHAKSDVNMDITNIVAEWFSGSIQNNGVIVCTSLESSSVVSNNSLRFFSTETNTIYSPYLNVFWDDSVYVTGSLSAATYPYSAIIKNLKKEYKFGSIPRIEVYVRPQNPLKNFVKDTQFNAYLTSSYLPPESYYSIKDNESEEVFIDFDDGTKLSCDGNMHYFKFDTTGLPQERYFRILIKVIDTDGGVNIIDNKNIFKVTR